MYGCVRRRHAVGIIISFCAGLIVAIIQLRNGSVQNDLISQSGTGQKLDVMHLNKSELDVHFYSFVSSVHYHCKNPARLGLVTDGGWNVCIAEPFLPSVPCLVYSFGINYDFSFDDDVSKMFGCTVRSFDPSMSRITDHRRGTNIWFYKIGIGDNNTVNSQGWPLATLDELLRKFNDTKVLIDYLKMDVEGSEWSALTNMFTTGVLNRVKQFGIEIHISNNFTVLPESWTILQKLDELGFRRWYFAINTSQSGRKGFTMNTKTISCCYEMVYINRRFIT